MPFCPNPTVKSVSFDIVSKDDTVRTVGWGVMGLPEVTLASSTSRTQGHTTLVVRSAVTDDTIDLWYITCPTISTKQAGSLPSIRETHLQIQKDLFDRQVFPLIKAACSKEGDQGSENRTSIAKLRVIDYLKSEAFENTLASVYNPERLPEDWEVISAEDATDNTAREVSVVYRHSIRDTQETYTATKEGDEWVFKRDDSARPPAMALGRIIHLLSS